LTATPVNLLFQSQQNNSNGTTRFSGCENRLTWEERDGTTVEYVYTESARFFRVTEEQRIREFDVSQETGLVSGGRLRFSADDLQTAFDSGIGLPSHKVSICTRRTEF
jgi:hypothetical protein